ncbi:hypothetical protein EC968_006752 [Mortierella alpina]|nr:hypothetical protein EC968_006752 [Mortierella alpina]
MSETQSFQLLGTTDIVEIPIQHMDDQNIVYWESIEQVFPGVKCVKNDDVPVQCFIKQVPDKVLKVILSSTTNHVRADSEVEGSTTASITALNFTPVANGTESSTNYPMEFPSDHKSVEDLLVATAQLETPMDDLSARIQESSTLPSSIPSQVKAPSKTTLSFQRIVKLVSEKARESDGPVQKQELSALMATMFQLQQTSDLKQDKMIEMFIDLHDEIKQLKKDCHAKQEEILQLQRDSDAKQGQLLEHQKNIEQLQIAAAAKQEQMDQLNRDHQERMEKMQQQIIDQVSVLQYRVQAILTQTFELHEYPIPRLFVVLPEDPSA